MKIKNENEKQESKTNIENENQNQESNLKMEIENENPKWDLLNTISWIHSNGYCLEAIEVLLKLLKLDVAVMQKDKQNYRNTLILISKITNDNTIKDIVDDTLNGK